MIKTVDTVGEVAIIVLEPGNIRKMKAGKPIDLNLEELGRPKRLFIDFTPDIEWLADKLKEVWPNLEAGDLGKLIEASRTRPEIDRGDIPKSQDYQKLTRSPWEKGGKYKN